MRTDGTTTIRVSTGTRDRLNALLREDRFTGRTIDTLVQHLLDEDWKAECIRDYDRWREEDPDGWERHVQQADAGTSEWGRMLNETEGPYFRNDAERAEAGLPPLQSPEVAA